MPAPAAAIVVNPAQPIQPATDHLDWAAALVLVAVGSDNVTVQTGWA